MISNIKITDVTLLSDNWYKLSKFTYEGTNKDGSTVVHTREAYDRGNGAVILLYNKELQTVVLTRQFRLPTFINGNADGMLIEACAGLLDQDNAEDCIKRETEEETGYRITNVQKVFEAYMSPGSVTEILYFFIAAYSPEMEINEGGGLAEEQENIERLVLDYQESLAMMEDGRIKDGKTIMLLQHLALKGLMNR
jgi:GDP-mannose pyrophosphatase NudK